MCLSTVDAFPTCQQPEAVENTSKNNLDHMKTQKYKGLSFSFHSPSVEQVIQSLQRIATRVGSLWTRERVEWRHRGIAASRHRGIAASRHRTFPHLTHSLQEKKSFSSKKIRECSPNKLDSLLQVALRRVSKNLY